MAIKDFMNRGERAGEGGEAEATRPLPAAPAMRTVAPSTSVDASSELEGTLRCRESLRIDGLVRGEVDCEKTVFVGQGATVEARVTAEEVRIAGIVEGDIAARRKITLERTAVVTGDLTTPGIVIEEGAKLKGRIMIGSDAISAADPKKAQPSKKAQAAAPRSEPASSPQPAPSTA